MTPFDDEQEFRTRVSLVLWELLEDQRARLALLSQAVSSLQAAQQAASQGTSGSITPSAPAFDPADPGTIGAGTPADGYFQNLYVSGGRNPPAAGTVELYQAGGGGVQEAGVGVVNQYGSAAALVTSSASGTGDAGIDLLPLTLAVDETYDYPPGNGGLLLVALPGATSTPVALIGFAANGATTLNGAVPASGISLTQDTAGKVNIYASGGLVRFQNKVGATTKVLAVPFLPFAY